MRSVLISAIFVVASALASAQPLRSAEAEEAQRGLALEASAFADSLLAQGDHYRAITEYKRAIFLAPTSPEASAWALQIGVAYRLGEQFDAAAKQYDAVAQSDSKAKGDALLGAARAYLAANQLESAIMRARDAAAEFNEQPSKQRQARYVEGWALVRAQRDDEAAKAFREARGEGAVGIGATRIVEVLPQLKTLPSKSPLLAGMLGLIPGAGHLYIGDPATAMSALAWNGVFGWAIYASSKARNWPVVAVLVMFESMWYGGSIVGAIGGAHRYNRDARHNAMDDLEKISPSDVMDSVRERQDALRPIAPTGEGATSR